MRPSQIAVTASAKALGGRLPLGTRLRQRNRGLRRDLELVDPHRQAVGTGDAERSLFEYHHAHGLQHRQQLTQRGRSTTQIPSQPGGLVIVVVGQHQLHRIVGQFFDDGDVIDRISRGVGLFVRLGERPRVVLGIDGSNGACRSPRRSAGQTRCARLRSATPESALGWLRRCRSSRQLPSELSRTMKCNSAQGDSVTRAVNSRLVPPNSRTRMSSICKTHGRGVAVAGQVDEAGDEVLESVSAQEQQRSAPGSEIQHGFGHRQQLLGAEREKL